MAGRYEIANGSERSIIQTNLGDTTNLMIEKFTYISDIHFLIIEDKVCRVPHKLQKKLLTDQSQYFECLIDI